MTRRKVLLVSMLFQSHSSLHIFARCNKKKKNTQLCEEKNINDPENCEKKNDLGKKNIDLSISFVLDDDSKRYLNGLA